MKVARESSFIQFVYPFLFDPTKFDERKANISSAEWQGREGSFKIWQKAQFPRDDLLAHVERYLNPPEDTAPTALIWKMDGNALQSPSGLGSSANWTLNFAQKEVPFEFDDVRFILFRTGVGFVTIAAKPKSEEINHWLDFLHFFRFVRGQRNVSVKAKRRVGKDEFTYFFPEPAGGSKIHPEGEGTFSEILEAILKTGSKQPESPNAKWWREVFVPGQLIPFAVIYVDDEDISERQIAELIYRVRNFFPSERVIQPAEEDLSFDHSSLLPYAEKMWFVFSLEGGAFVAVNAPKTDFFRRELPNHLRDQYFLLFLLTLHQRFTLMSLSEDVSVHWLQGKERLKAFERIRNRLLDFTARGYFTQVMQREHHHRAYRKWQEIFQLDQLYLEVCDEVREMHEYILSEQTKRLEQRLNMLGALVGIPALVMSFLSINLYGITAKEEGLSIWVALGISIFGFGLGGLVWLLLSRR